MRHRNQNNDNETQEPTSINPTSFASTFFETRTIKQAVVKRPKRKFVPPYLAGNLANKSNMDIIQSKTTPCKKAKLTKDFPPKKTPVETTKKTTNETTKKTPKEITKKTKSKENHVNNKHQD